MSVQAGKYVPPGGFPVRRRNWGKVLLSLLLALSIMVNGFMLMRISSLNDKVEEQDATISLMTQAADNMKRSQTRAARTPGHAAKPAVTADSGSVAASDPLQGECWIRDGNTFRDCKPESRDY